MLVLCRSDTYYTLKLWRHVIPQAKITLNMLCPSRLQHQLFDQLHTAQYFECETNPIGYPGTCVAVNVRPTDCLYWLTHGNPWWYILLRVDNYNFRSVYINKTREKQVINTVDFSPNSTMPCMTLGDEKTCASLYVAQLLLPKSCKPHTINQFFYKLN